jgi:hypothetical protein
MPLIIALIALITPRIVIVLLWLLTNWFQGIFATVLIPIIGFIFLPTTLLWYSAVQNWFGGEWTLVPIIGVVIAILLDLSPMGGRRRRYRY